MPARRTAAPLFELQLEDDELLAMAIRNELDEAALADVFSSSHFFDGADLPDEEADTRSLLPHLTPVQRCAGRVALLGHRESDDAHTLAVRSPEGSPEDRIRIAEEVFLGRMEIDILHKHEGWSGFTAMAQADAEERIANLPEPWRKHAKKRLPELRARVRETLAHTSAQGPPQRSDSAC